MVIWASEPSIEFTAYRKSSDSLAILAAIRRASLRVSFMVLYVMVLCVSVVGLGESSLLLGVVKKPTPCRVGIAIAEKAVLSNCGRCDCNADAQGQKCCH
jgi:hypothetical protein